MSKTLMPNPQMIIRALELEIPTRNPRSDSRNPKHPTLTRYLKPDTLTRDTKSATQSCERVADIMSEAQVRNTEPVPETRDPTPETRNPGSETPYTTQYPKPSTLNGLTSSYPRLSLPLPPSLSLSQLSLPWCAAKQGCWRQSIARHGGAETHMTQDWSSV